MYPWLRLAKFYHTSIVGILDCSWSQWYYVCWIFPSLCALAHITYSVPKWRCNITEISRLHQLCHDNVQISWYHITTLHFESFFGAWLIKNPGQRKSTAESHRRHKPAFDSDLVLSRLQCDLLRWFSHWRVLINDLANQEVMTMPRM